MKISFLCNSVAWGGLEMITCKEAQWLAASGHQVTVLCPPQSRASITCQENNIAVIDFAPKSKYADIPAIRNLASFLKTQDILLISQSSDVNLAVLAKIFSGSPCKLVYMQNMQIGISKRDLIHTFFYRNLDAWISPLKMLKENTLHRTRIQAEKIHIIPIGIETEKFAILPYTQEEARTKLQLPQGVKIAVIIGRIDPGKGQEFLIKAVATLKKQGQILHVAIIGEETYGDKRQYLQYLKTLTKDLQVEDLVHFCPFQKDVPLAYSAIDFFVMASTHETYGLVTLEAMAAQKIVVAAYAGGTKELVQDQETGVFFESENAEDLAAKLFSLLTHQEQIDKITKQALRYVKANYDYTQQVRKLNELFAAW